jgi:hypothetical protein
MPARAGGKLEGNGRAVHIHLQLGVPPNQRAWQLSAGVLVSGECSVVLSKRAAVSAVSRGGRPLRALPAV